MHYKKIQFETFEWIVTDNPCEKDLINIFAEYEIHNVEIQSILQQDSRAKLDIYKSYNYLKLNFLKYNKKFDILEINEMHNIYWKNFLITIMNSSSRKLEKLIWLYGYKKERKSIYEILFEVLDSQVSKGSRIVDYIEKEVTYLETQAYKILTKESIFELSKKRKNLIVFKHTSMINIPVLESFSQSIKNETLQITFDNLIDKAHKTAQEILILEESVNWIDATVKSLFDVKNNDIIKKFTIISFIFIPLNLATGIFWMNIEVLPFPIWIILSVFWSILAGIIICILIYKTILFK